MSSILLALAVTAASPSMTAGEFLARAEPLLSKSQFSLVFSSEARSLMRLVGDTAQQTRDRLDTDRAAGRHVTTCLPPKGQATIESRELLAYLHGLSPAERGQSFQQAFSGYAARKYPCRR